MLIDKLKAFKVLVARPGLDHTRHTIPVIFSIVDARIVPVFVDHLREVVISWVGKFNQWGDDCSVVGIIEKGAVFVHEILLLGHLEQVDEECHEVRADQGA